MPPPPASRPWTAESLVNYLRDWDPKHDGTAGPMGPMVHNLSQVDEDEVRVIAAYLATLFGSPSAEHFARTEAIAA